MQELQQLQLLQQLHNYNVASRALLRMTMYLYMTVCLPV